MNCREMRETERTRYLAVNGTTLPDADDRWWAYEDLILNKFGRGLKFPGTTREFALDEAWASRDRYNRAQVGSNKRTR
jgi:hypothetical protein